jgi:hypothetical protein
MKPSSLERALDAMESIMPGEPYALRPGDPKRKLIHELARISRELKIRPVVIGGLAVNHHGYLRVTVDVDLLLSKDDALKLHRRLKDELGWKRYGEGFKNTTLGVGVDMCVERGGTSPSWREFFPHPAEIKVLKVSPMPVPSLEELVLLKAKSGRLKDDGDLGELLKRHPRRIESLHQTVRNRLETSEARRHFDGVVARAKEELARRP